MKLWRSYYSGLSQQSFADSESAHERSTDDPGSQDPPGYLCGGEAGRDRLEDEVVLGSAYTGVGTNFTLGGTIKAPCHYDLLVWHPKIEVDGEVLIAGKEVRV